MNRVPTKLVQLTLPLIVAVASAGEVRAALLDINWASAASNVVTNGGPFDPNRMLGAPDGLVTSVWEGGAADGVEETATFSGFGSGAKTATDMTSLASFLGVSQAVIAQADFVAFEFNGIPFPFEQSRWEFSDSTNSLAVNYAVPFLPPPPVVGVIATGDITAASYINFFGPLVNNPNVSTSIGFILFDISGNSLVNIQSLNFSAKISAGLSAGESPDPDALGSITSTAAIPEPSTLVLWSLGAVTFVGLGWRRRNQAA